MSELLDLKSQITEQQREIDQLREELAGLPARWRTQIVLPPYRLGLIVCNGPNGEPEFADNRYWVRAARVSNNEGDAASASVEITEDPDNSEIVCATNLFEDNCKTHNLRPGTPVAVFSAEDAGEPATTRYFLITADEGTCRSGECAGSSSSSSSSSESSSSSSSASSGGNKCFAVWFAAWNCESEEWSGPAQDGWVCLPADTNTDWHEYEPCLMRKYVLIGTDCDDLTDCQDQSTDPPSLPESPPPSCCQSSSSESESSASSASSGESSGGSSGGSGGSGSEKSTAIVPASWTRTGYTALFVSEAPEVRFDDVLEVSIPQRNALLKIDPRFIEVCEPGSIRVCGVACDHPIAVGASMTPAGRVRIRFNRSAKRKVNLVIRLTGIRKGFVRLRFPARTREQFEANERFINSAYPGNRNG